MVAIVGMAGADNTEVVDALADFGKNLAYFQSALTTFAELERRTHEVARGAVGLNFWTWHGFAVVFVESRLRVEGVHLRPTAVHEKEDHALGASGEMRRLGLQRPVSCRAERVRKPQHSESSAHQS